jgi:hypothetical protein
MRSDSSPIPLHAAGTSPRRPWVAPSLTQLAPLTALTLQSGSPVDGTGTPGGYTFSVLTGRGRPRLG